jgi:hypothetical protein
MLWYEELFLLFLRARPGPFEIAGSEVVISGDLHTQRDRRTVWWDCVKDLSRVDEDGRSSFLREARIQFGLDARNDFSGSSSPAYSRRFQVLKLSELRELAAAGMTIGAHTLTHPMLSKLPIEAAYAEIAESRSKLAAALERPAWAFAYPFGDSQSVTPSVLEMPQRAGYEAAFLNYGGGLETDLPKYALPRIHVTAEMNLAEFEAHVSGFYARTRRYVECNLKSVDLKD